MAKVKIDPDNALRQALRQVAGIRELVAALVKAEEANDDRAREDAEQAIHEDPLSVEVRDGWYSPGGERGEPEEWNILLCTGGPAVRLIGTLGRYNEANNVEVEYQDWGTPWTALVPSQYADGDEEALLRYANFFLGFWLST